ncbi:MAG: serine protease [bacterium]
MISKHVRYVTMMVALFARGVMGATGSTPLINDAIVKIYTEASIPDYGNPWNAGNPSSFTGSGCIIKGRKILTNAHVISDGTFIQVRRYGQSRRYEARVENVSHDADLALLTVEDPDFFTGSTSLELDDLPAVQQEVSVYGFPLGGDTMSITKGVVSRVEHQVYPHSGLSLLAVQIDAPINPGNSGGPAIVDGRIAGVAMMAYDNKDANSIGYIVPTAVIRHFFDDIADGRQNGFPSTGLIMQNMENPAMKHSYGIADRQEGVLVSKVIRGGSAEGFLKAGDVVTALDDVPVAGDGTVDLRKDERTSCDLIVQKHQVGEKLKIDYVRDGKPHNCMITLSSRMADDLLVPLERYDVMPTYYIFGGLVFCPLTTDYVKAWGENWPKEAPPYFLTLLSANMKSDSMDEVVILTRVLAGNINQGYQDLVNLPIKKVNGHDLGNLRELITRIESSKEPFVTLEATTGQRIVLGRERCLAEQQAILKTYQISHDRSVDLLTPVMTTAK